MSRGRRPRCVECGGGGGRSSCAKVWSGVLGASKGSRDNGAKFLGKVIDIPAFFTAEVAFNVGDMSNVLAATGVEPTSDEGVAMTWR